MDLLQLTVLSLNVAKEHSKLVIFVFSNYTIQRALSPDLVKFSFHFYNLLWGFSFLLQMFGELMSVCSRRICIFIPLNKREMRSRAPRLLLCDRNHIIDWHTESCPSNSPRGAGAAWDENKDRFEAAGVYGQTVSLSLALPFSLSLCFSQSFTKLTRKIAKGIVAWNTKQEDNSLFLSTADVICVPLNCCILCSSNLQSHCVEHAPWLLCICCWQALCISYKTPKFTCHLH